MPELPEVETIVRQLSPLLTGQKLKRLRILDKKLATFPESKIIGKEILKVKRVGKQVFLGFGQKGRIPQAWLGIHLRMTGRLLWNSERNAVDKHTRAQFNFLDGDLVFNDVRRFGTFQLLDSIDEEVLDPVSEDFTPDVLKLMLSRSKQELKVWLLRQDRLVGIGNIYASEILFDAGIHPRRRGDELSQAEIGRLFRSIKKILERAILNAGTTFSDYRDAEGNAGGFQNLLKVYDREGKFCRKCKGEIKRITQVQRSTFYCEACQKR